jgi:hypothetical protein
MLQEVITDAEKDAILQTFHFRRLNAKEYISCDFHAYENANHGYIGGTRFSEDRTKLLGHFSLAIQNDDPYFCQEYPLSFQAEKTLNDANSIVFSVSFLGQVLTIILNADLLVSGESTYQISYRITDFLEGILEGELPFAFIR